MIETFDAGDTIKVLELSPCKTQVLAGGRNLLQLQKIDKELKMTLTLKLHTRKNRNLNFGANDLKWNHLNDQYFVSSSPNSSIHVWNIDQCINEQKRLPIMTYDEHKGLSKLSWDPFNANQFISGCADTFIKVWDIKLDRSVLTLQKKQSSNDAIHNVQFSPIKQNCFAACYASGSIEIWDLRKQNNSVQTINAYTKAAMCVDWHPEVADVLITGSHDKSIKGWNLQDNGQGQSNKTLLSQLFKIQTASGIKKCQWMPNKSFMISANLENTVSVWHCKKPYLQQYIFKGKETVTDYEWLNDENIIISMDKYIKIQHISTALRPYERICTTGHDFSINNDFAYINDKISYRNPDKFLASLEETSTIESLLSKENKLNKSFASNKQDLSEQGVLHICKLDQSDSDESRTNKDQIEYLASNTIFKGKSIEEMCLHNSKKFAKINLQDVEQSWLELAEIAKELKIIVQCTMQVQDKKYTSKESAMQIKFNRDESKTSQIDTQRQKQKAMPSRSSRKYSYTIDNEEPIVVEKQEPQGTKIFENNYLDIQIFDEIQEEETEDIKAQKSSYLQRSRSPSMNFIQPTRKQHGSTQDLDVNTYAVIFDKPITMQSLHQNERNGNKKKSVRANNQSSFGQRKMPYMQKWILDVVQTTVIDTIRYYIDNGDLQTGALMTLVFIDHLKNLQNYQAYINRIVISYIEMLRSVGLKSQGIELIKQLPDLQEVRKFYKIDTQKTFGIAQVCQYCKSLEAGIKNHMCSNDKCKKIVSTCVVCSLPVKSLYLWCQGCSHGGHTEHFNNWFLYNKYCPAGCGHQCIE